MFEETTDGTLLMLSKVSAISTVKQDEETGNFCDRDWETFT